MESLSETAWDVVISGTWLQQSLLALALSRSGRNILHVDPNDYYGGPEAALSLQEVEAWAERYAGNDGEAVFARAEVKREGEGLRLGRGSYSLALAPQVIHTKSQLLSQLISSKAFRQVDFLAVGSFYIFQPPSSPSSTPTLSRIPSTREDVFTNTAIPARAKRSLMKFLKFVLEYDAEPQTELWKPRASEPLTEFLASEFKFDESLQSYVVTLTLSLDGKVTVEAGLAAIHRHLTSTGVFGAGFAAVYPKWGGLSEIAQVGCRAGAVGGAVYMLGVGIKDVKQAESSEATLSVTLANDLTVKTKTLIQGSVKASEGSVRVSRLTAVVKSGLSSVFETIVEGAPTPAVAVVAFQAGSISTEDGAPSDYPVYVTLHSSETGECPAGQCVIYLSTISTTNSKALLEIALSSLLAAIAGPQEPPKSLYQLSYEQNSSPPSLDVDGNVGTFAAPSLSLAFDDSVLDPVRQAWNMVAGDAAEEGVEYMVFEDREGVTEEDDL